MTRTATCCCGAFRLVVEGEPTLNAICNCDDCKRRTGSAFGWNAYFQLAQCLSKSGNTRVYRQQAAPNQARERCDVCGSILYWTTPLRPGKFGVAAGAFIDPPLDQPLHSARDTKRCVWVARPAGMEPWP